MQTLPRHQPSPGPNEAFPVCENTSDIDVPWLCATCVNGYVTVFGLDSANIEQSSYVRTAFKSCECEPEQLSYEQKS